MLPDGLAKTLADSSDAQRGEIIGLRRIFHREIGISGFTVGYPFMQPDGRNDRAGGPARLAIAELGQNGNADLQRLPGADAAILRKRIEAEIDVVIGREMLQAGRRSQTLDAFRRDPMGSKPRDDELTQRRVIERTGFDRNPRLSGAA